MSTGSTSICCGSFTSNEKVMDSSSASAALQLMMASIILFHENPLDMNPDLQSTKRDTSALHGLGLKNIDKWHPIEDGSYS